MKSCRPPHRGLASWGGWPVRLEWEEQSERRSGTVWQRFRTALQSQQPHGQRVPSKGKAPGRDRSRDHPGSFCCPRETGRSLQHARGSGQGQNWTGRVREAHYCLSETTAPPQSREFLSLLATALSVSGTQVGADLLDTAVFLCGKQGGPFGCGIHKSTLYKVWAKSFHQGCHCGTTS